MFVQVIEGQDTIRLDSASRVDVGATTCGPGPSALSEAPLE